MPSRILAGIGLRGDWLLGENNWKDENDVNLVTLSVLAGGRALSRLDATPATPAEGDIHIFGAAHPTNANAIAVFNEGAWFYITPLSGMTMFSVADDATFEYRATGGWRPVGGLLIRPAQIGNYQAALLDANAYTPFNVASPANFTIPTNATVPFPVGTRLIVEQMGAGTVAFVGAAGVTINSRGAAVTTAGQWAVAQAIQRAVDVWTITGDVA